jgi:hypothetical protein
MRSMLAGAERTEGMEAAFFGVLLELVSSSIGSAAGEHAKGQALDSGPDRASGPMQGKFFLRGACLLLMRTPKFFTREIRRRCLP